MKCLIIRRTNSNLRKMSSRGIVSNRLYGDNGIQKSVCGNTACSIIVLTIGLWRVKWHIQWVCRKEMQQAWRLWIILIPLLLLKYRQKRTYVREQLYQHTNFNESITINCLPLYFLNTNERIEVFHESSNIYGDYMIKSINLPLSPESLMSITAIRAQQRI